MKKLWIGGGFIIAILVVTVLALLLFQNNDDPEQQQETKTAYEVNSKLLASKNTKEACWFGYNGRVFDITRKFTAQSQNQDSLEAVCGLSVDSLPTDFKNIEDLVQYQIGILVP